MEEQFAFAPVSAPKMRRPEFGAGFWLRAVARIIDMAVHWGTSLAAGAAFTIAAAIFLAVMESPSTQFFNEMQVVTAWDYAFALFGAIVYHTLAEGLHGATLGKRILRLHVLKENGDPASIGQAFVRSLAFLIDGLFFGAIAAGSMQSSELNQRVGDKWAKTVVVQRKELSGHPWPSDWRFLFVFLLAVCADGIVSLMGVVIKMMLM